MYNATKTFVWLLDSGWLGLQAIAVHVFCVHMRAQAPTHMSVALASNMPHVTCGACTHILVQGLLWGKGEQYGTLPLQLLVRQHVPAMGRRSIGTLMSAFGSGALSTTCDGGSGTLTFLFVCSD